MESTPACGDQAILLITREIDGTSTSVARQRTELRCDLRAGHEGNHKDTARDESWPADGRVRPTLVRHETESPTRS